MTLRETITPASRMTPRIIMLQMLLVVLMASLWTHRPVLCNKQSITDAQQPAAEAQAAAATNSTQLFMHSPKSGKTYKIGRTLKVKWISQLTAEMQSIRLDLQCNLVWMNMGMADKKHLKNDDECSDGEAVEVTETELTTIEEGAEGQKEDVQQREEQPQDVQQQQEQAAQDKQQQDEQQQEAQQQHALKRMEQDQHIAQEEQLISVKPTSVKDMFTWTITEKPLKNRKSNNSNHLLRHKWTIPTDFEPIPSCKVILYGKPLTQVKPEEQEQARENNTEQSQPWMMLQESGVFSIATARKTTLMIRKVRILPRSIPNTEGKATNQLLLEWQCQRNHDANNKESHQRKHRTKDLNTQQNAVNKPFCLRLMDKDSKECRAVIAEGIDLFAQNSLIWTIPDDSVLLGLSKRAEKEQLDNGLTLQTTEQQHTDNIENTEQQHTENTQQQDTEQANVQGNTEQQDTVQPNVRENTEQANTQENTKRQNAVQANAQENAVRQDTTRVTNSKGQHQMKAFKVEFVPVNETNCCCQQAECLNNRPTKDTQSKRTRRNKMLGKKFTSAVFYLPIRSTKEQGQTQQLQQEEEQEQEQDTMPAPLDDQVLMASPNESAMRKPILVQCRQSQLISQVNEQEQQETAGETGVKRVRFADRGVRDLQRTEGGHAVVSKPAAVIKHQNVERKNAVKDVKVSIE